MKVIIRFSLIRSGHELIGWFSTRLQSLKVPTQFSKNPGYSVTKAFESTSSSVMNFRRRSHNGIVRRSVGYRSGLSRALDQNRERGARRRMVSVWVQGQKLKSMSMHSARSEISTPLKFERLHGSTEILSRTASVPVQPSTRADVVRH
jgi:hypothetical protein